MTQYKTVPLSTIKEGQPFWCPDELLEGTVRLKHTGSLLGMIDVNIIRYKGHKPGPDRLVGKMAASGNWPVVPGAMPPEIKKAAEQELKALQANARDLMARQAYKMFRNGKNITAIGEAIGVGEQAAQDLIRHGQELDEEEQDPSTPPPIDGLQATRSHDETDREAYRLRHEENLSYPTIAARIGYKSPSSARAAVLRGAKLMAASTEEASA